MSPFMNASENSPRVTESMPDLDFVMEGRENRGVMATPSDPTLGLVISADSAMLLLLSLANVDVAVNCEVWAELEEVILELEMAAVSRGVTITGLKADLELEMSRAEFCSAGRLVRPGAGSWGCPVVVANTDVSWMPNSSLNTSSDEEGRAGLEFNPFSPLTSSLTVSEVAAGCLETATR